MRTPWHGSFEVPINTTAFWQAGPYQLWLRRSAHEWKVASVQGADSLGRSLHVEVPSDRTDPPEAATVRRFAYKRSPGEVKLTPALADRPVVVSPEEPLHLPSKEQITVFISTPVWVELTLGDSPIALLDEPTHRPTDTWFGPSSMKGELCYATRTAARMNLDNVPARPHRVITVVEIRNRAKETLTVEKLKIPVTHQEVYATEDGSLWTGTLTLEHHEEGEMATVRLGKGPPANARNAALVRGPRSPMEAGLLTRAFGGFTS